MFWSRLWLVLLSIVAALATAAALLAPRPLADELDQETTRRLERAQQATAWFLRVNARQWMDTVAHDATDAVLVNGLQEATKGPADLAMVHKTVQERLRAFAEKAKVDVVMATDGKGRVIARAGLDEGVYKDFVEGLPLVSDALRGLRGDDTWSLDGKLYRVAASPVIAPGKYVGCLVMGQEVGAALAQSLASMMGVEVAFLLRGRLIAASTQLPVAQQLPLSANEQAALMQKEGRSPALSLGDGEGRHLAVLAPFSGEAAAHGAIYALLAARPPTESVTGLMARLLATDPQTLPWSALAPVGGGLVLALLLAFLLLRLEATGPLKRLVRDSQALARGELPRIQDALYPGTLGQIARAVNTTLDRLGSRPASPLPAPTRRGPAQPGGLFDEQPGASATQDDKDTPLPKPLPARPMEDSQPQPFPLPPPVKKERKVTVRGIGPETRPAPSLGELKYDDSEQTEVTGNSYDSMLAEADSGAPARVADPLEAELRAVFHEFLQTKHTCGEPTATLTYEKFSDKLRTQRAQLIAKYSCQTVRFQVYIKDGRAALKATPEG
jgi:hypothetical protein